MTARRELLIAFGVVVLATPVTIFGQQQGRIWRVGFLAPRHVDFVDTDYYYGPFRQAMRELGYVEGKNLVIEWRSSEGNDALLPGLAAELVNLGVDVIVTAGTPAALVLQKATSTIPIVIGAMSDPVGSGLVKSLARPGGNITGHANMTGDLRLKQLEMLLAVVPRLSRVAVLSESREPVSPSSGKQLERLQSEGQKRGVTILRAAARTPQEIDNAFLLIRRQNAGALIVSQPPLFIQQKTQISELIAKHRLPAAAGPREFVEAGLLMSYGSSIADPYRRAATYVDKIFKGAKPADLPIEQPTKFELVINRKTAKALGLTIPQSLLISADRVIE